MVCFLNNNTPNVKSQKVPKYSQSVHPSSPLVHKGKRFRDIHSENSLRAHCRRSTTLQYMGIMEHAILNFDNNMSTNAALCYIKATFYKPWNIGFLHKWYKLEYWTGPIKLIRSLISQRKFKVQLEGKYRLTCRTVSSSSLCSMCMPPTIVHIYINIYLCRRSSKIDLIRTPRLG
jgi:hypothetical protein